jgi:hypothetical protein
MDISSMPWPSRKTFDMGFNKNSVLVLENFAKNLDKYPNRIQRAMGTAAAMTERELRKELSTRFNNDRLGHEDVVQILYKPMARGGIKFTVEVLYATGHPRSSKNFDPMMRARFDANIKMTGRRRYVARRKAGKRPYDLRSWDGGLNDASYGFTIRRKPKNLSFESLVKRKPVKLFNDNLNKALRKEGFGVRGGSGSVGADISVSAATRIQGR